MKPGNQRIPTIGVPIALLVSVYTTLLSPEAAHANGIRNPLGVDNLEDLLKIISDKVVDIVIPIAVLLYIYAGFNMLIAAGRPAYINKAKQTFLYTTLGLLVIFIGSGFVDLIRSILNP